jgi:hypothetical protein
LAEAFKLGKSDGNSNHNHEANLNRNIVNLSDYALSPSDKTILQKGLSFVPTPRITKTPILKAAETLSRRLKLYHFFNARPTLQNSYQKLPFTGKSNWTPPDSKIDNDVHKCISDIIRDINGIKLQSENSNISADEMSSLHRLSKNENIVIKKADKGSAIVIMNKEDYLFEGYRQLQNPLHYKRLEKPIFMETAKLITDILIDLKEASYISEKQLKFLQPTADPRSRIFYTLPKIHKPTDKWTVPGKIPPGRPIVSDCDSESEKVAGFIDDYIKGKANKHPSYLKDTYDFVEKIKDLEIPEGALLITLDVESMYTNINHDKGLEAVAGLFEERERNPKFHAVMKLLELSLKRNDFKYNNQHFLQISGTSMGKKWAPHYADIYMAKFEKEALDKCLLKPYFYHRFLDDVFMIWTHGLRAFYEFLDIFNSHQPEIKFKAEIRNMCADFLDTTVFKNPEDETRLMTKVFFKPTDTHQLLFKNSFHPRHTFSGVLKSQVTRFYRICSRQEDFEEAWQILYQALSKRNYSRRWLRKIKNQTFLDLQTKDRISLEQLCNPSSSKTGASACGSNRCMTCRIIPACQNFTGTMTGETFGINSFLNCDSTNLIYLYTCKFCHSQYVGETGKCLRDRANRHRAAIYSENLSSPLYVHLSEIHSREVKSWNDENFILTPIEQIEEMPTKTLTKMRRLERETFWIDTLNTFDKFGLNSRILDHLIKPKKQDAIPFVVPYSKTGNLAARIIKGHIEELRKKDEFNDFDYKVVTAYSRHKNLKGFLVSSNLKS